MIELVIGMGIIGVVGTLAVSMLFGAFSTQRAVVSGAAVTTRGQSIGDLIDAGLRQASAVRVSTDGTRLDLQLADGSCEGFRASPTKLEYRRFTLSATSPLPTISTPAWANLTSDPQTSFQVVRLPTASPSPYFTSPTAPSVAYSFRLTDGTASVDVVSMATPRGATGGTSKCLF